MGFQLNYLFLYFIISNLATDPQEVIRYAALLRGTESAWQAVSYGLNSVVIFAEVAGVYFNFGLWAISLYPAWLVLRHFGTASHKTVESGAVNTALQGVEKEGATGGKSPESVSEEVR